MHTPARRIEVFQEGRLAGEIGVRREHNPYYGTDLADIWEDGRQNGELNYEMFKRDLDHTFAGSGKLLAIVFITVFFLFTITILAMMGY